MKEQYYIIGKTVKNYTAAHCFDNFVAATQWKQYLEDAVPADAPYFVVLYRIDEEGNLSL